MDKKIIWDSRRKVAFSMVMPAFLILLLLAVGPNVFMFINAFRSWRLSAPIPPRFNGLGNFLDLLTDARFINAISNTAILAIIGIVIQSILGLGIALLLWKPFKLRSAIMALLLVPVLVTPVVAGLNWKLILNDVYGPLNYLFKLIGMKGPLWLSSNRFWGLLSILIVDAWQWTPFVALVLLSGLEGIPKEIYEAADVDGTKPARVFFRLTLPLLRPMFVLVMLLRTIFILRIFDPIVILTQGGPGMATESLSLLMYNVGLKYMDIGHAMAMGVLQVIFMIIMVNIFLRFTTSSKIGSRSSRKG